MSCAEPLDLDALRARYLAALLAGQRREALRLVLEEGLGRGASALDVHVGVIQEAQRELGRLWEENTVSVAQEHLASAISSTALAHIYDRAPRAASNGRKVVVACVEGEQHDLPARLVADALDLAGFEVRFLGASVPLDHLLRLLLDERPDLLALSVTMAFNVPAVRAAVARVRAAFPGLPVFVGGNACVWLRGLVQELAVSTGRDAREVVAAARAATGVAA